MKKYKKILLTIGAILLFFILRYMSSTILLESFRLGNSFEDSSLPFYMGVVINALAYIVPIVLIVLIWRRKGITNG